MGTRMSGHGSAVFGVAAALWVAGCAVALPSTAEDGCATTPTALKSLSPSKDCDKCRDTLLPGRIAPDPRTVYTLWSDLPEVFCSEGVLYSTAETLSADLNGNPLPEMRKQERDPSFTTIDDSFDVFIFHTVYGCEGGSPTRRIVVYARNDSPQPVTISPRQVISTDGEIGRVHEMESTLGRRVMEQSWDTPIASVTIPPGQGDVIAFSKQFAAKENGPGSSRSVNCFGRVRAIVREAGSAALTVSVVAIDAGPIDENRARAEAALKRGAVSGEKQIDLTTRPSGCQVRRATGVFRSFQWRNNPIVIDANDLPEKGIVFPMALWSRATEGCPEARQSAPLILHPAYTRDDTIGNYMVDYYVDFQIVNRNQSEPRRVDVRFGKSDADIGLAWRIAQGEEAASEPALESRPVRTGWAGPKQKAPTRSFLESDGDVLQLGPCERKVVSLHFMVLGNSSLPFDLRIERAGPLR